MGFLILVRQYLYIETGPWSLQTQQAILQTYTSYVSLWCGFYIFSIITFLTLDQSYCKGVLRIYVFLTIPFASLIVSVGTRGQFQCPIRRLIIRSRKVSMVRNWYLELLDRVEIWQFSSWAASQMSRRYNCFYESHGLRYFHEVLRNVVFWDIETSPGIFNGLLLMGSAFSDRKE